MHPTRVRRKIPVLRSPVDQGSQGQGHHSPGKLRPEAGIQDMLLPEEDSLAEDIRGTVEGILGAGTEEDSPEADIPGVGSLGIAAVGIGREVGTGQAGDTGQEAGIDQDRTSGEGKVGRSFGRPDKSRFPEL